jgi:hypothetical protein
MKTSHYFGCFFFRFEFDFVGWWVGFIWLMFTKDIVDYVYGVLKLLEDVCVA